MPASTSTSTTIKTNPLDCIVMCNSRGKSAHIHVHTHILIHTHSHSLASERELHGKASALENLHNPILIAAQLCGNNKSNNGKNFMHEIGREKQTEH